MKNLTADSVSLARISYLKHDGRIIIMADTNEKYTSQRQGQERSRKRRNLYKPLTFFLIVFAIVMAMSVFFSIGRIVVEGNSLYTDEEVIAASGIQQGDNLFFLNRIAAGSRVAAKLPFVDSVTINRGLPNIVTIVVAESRAAGCIDIDGVLWTVGSTGKCLGMIEETAASDYAVISGIELNVPASGSPFEAAAGNEDKLDYLLDMVAENGYLRILGEHCRGGESQRQQE